MNGDDREDLEDGELSDTEGNYTPLERPANYASTLQPKYEPNPKVVESEEEEEQIQSSSESDSDCDKIKEKRPKLKPKIRTLPKDATRKKYDIWCNAAQEDVLLENLVNCDVSHIDRSRNVETYVTRRTNKRTRGDRKNTALRPNKRTDFPSHKNDDLVPRIILDLHCTVDDSDDDIAKDIANKLSEEKEDLIQLVVSVAGKAKAIELFKTTQQVEKDGGMMILNGTRRRTPGGVYLNLVKNDHELTREQQNDIFNEDKLKFKRAVRTNYKIKMQLKKQKIKAAGAKLLPELLSRREHELQSSSKKEPLEVDVKNPPPSPATDGLDNSTDGTENINSDRSSSRQIADYEEDCLDVGLDMELF